MANWVSMELMAAKVAEACAKPLPFHPIFSPGKDKGIIVKK